MLNWPKKLDAVSTKSFVQHLISLAEDLTSSFLAHAQ
jgi:hypothetical protein